MTTATTTQEQADAAPRRISPSAAFGALIMTVFLGAEAAVIMVAMCYFFTSGWVQTIAYALAGIIETWVLYACCKRAYTMEVDLMASHANATND